MVRGVEKFKEYFRDYAGQYTFDEVMNSIKECYGLYYL